MTVDVHDSHRWVGVDVFGQVVSTWHNTSPPAEDGETLWVDADRPDVTLGWYMLDDGTWLSPEETAPWETDVARETYRKQLLNAAVAERERRLAVGLTGVVDFTVPTHDNGVRNLTVYWCWANTQMILGNTTGTVDFVDDDGARHPVTASTILQISGAAFALGGTAYDWFLAKQTAIRQATTLDGLRAIRLDD